MMEGRAVPGSLRQSPSGDTRSATPPRLATRKFMMGLGGSKMLEDRRRRRLVLETEQDSSVTARTSGDLSDSADREVTPPDLWLFLPQVVPQKLWKCWTAGAVAAITFATLLTLWMFADEASMSGSIAGDMLAPLADRLLRGSGAVAWWLAAQMSCIVWWVRSRSQVDYGGRFHVWGWSAAAFMASAMLSLSDAHRSVAQVVAWVFTGVSANSAGMTALWLLPVTVAALTWWATLGTEFRNDFASRVLHSLSAIAALAMLSVELWSVRLGVTAQTELLGRLLLASLQWTSLMSVWLHLRHVVHVSVDPPNLGASGWLVAWRFGPGRVVSALSRRQPQESAEDVPTRMRVEAADGTAQEVRIDEAETTPKGPTKRTRQAARR